MLPSEQVWTRQALNHYDFHNSTTSPIDLEMNS